MVSYSFNNLPNVEVIWNHTVEEICGEDMVESIRIREKNSGEEKNIKQTTVRRKEMKSFGKTDIGRKRSVNQDYVYFSDTPIGRLPNLYVVADGMGGHKAGEVASGIVVDYLKEKFNSIKTIGTKEDAISWIRTTVSEINDKPKIDKHENKKYFSHYDGRSIVCKLRQGQ